LAKAFYCNDPPRDSRASIALSEYEDDGQQNHIWQLS